MSAQLVPVLRLHLGPLLSEAELWHIAAAGPAEFPDRAFCSLFLLSLPQYQGPQCAPWCFPLHGVPLWGFAALPHLLQPFPTALLRTSILVERKVEKENLRGISLQPSLGSGSLLASSARSDGVGRSECCNTEVCCRQAT